MKQNSSSWFVSLEAKFSAVFSVLILAYVLVGLQSCETRQLNESPSPPNGKIPEYIFNDPLFRSLDKSFYELQLASLKYRGEKIDERQLALLSQSVKNKKIKTMNEYYKAQEKIGFKDVEKRMKAIIYFHKVREELFRKYPELRSLPKGTFTSLFMSRRKYKIDPRLIMEMRDNS